MAQQVLFSILVIGCIVGVILQVLILLFSRRNRNLRKRLAMATVTQVEVVATTWTSGWAVTATWTDIQTGQIHTVRSHLLKSLPKQRIGDSVTVVFDPRNPKRSRVVM